MPLRIKQPDGRETIYDLLSNPYWEGVYVMRWAHRAYIKTHGGLQFVIPEEEGLLYLYHKAEPTPFRDKIKYGR